MYGVIIEVRVNPSREQEARNMVRDMIAPRSRMQSGFSTGYWLLVLQATYSNRYRFRYLRRARFARAERIRSESPRPALQSP